MARPTDRDDAPIDVSLRARLRYRFDNVLARGTTAALAWLGVVTLAAVLFSAALLTLFGVTFAGSDDSGLIEDTWQSLLRILDTGTMASDVGWGRRILALLVTLFGLLVAGTLIGIIAAGVEDRIDSMRRGRSTVIESGHLVILGGSARLPVIIEQLVLASAERGANTIVVLSQTDPTELRRAVLDAVPDQLRTHVVYRFGDPRVGADLALTRVSESRGVVVLPETNGDDTSVTQTVLALVAELGSLDELPVVVEVAEAITARRLVEACGPTMYPIVAAEAVARTGAFALRHRGLSKVINELTDFHGCDLHVTDRPDLRGVRFDEIVGRFGNARPLGIARPDGRFELNPPADSTLDDGDRLVVIAHDLERIEESGDPVRLRRDDSTEFSAVTVEEHILVLGWNPFGPDLLSGWSTAASPASTVEVAFDPRMIELSDVLVPPLDIEVRISAVEEASSIALDRVPTTIVVLGYTSIAAAAADARTMLDVMHLQRRISQSDGATTRFVVQLLDADQADLAVLTGADDFLISSALGSQFIAQLIEQPERRAVLLALYTGGDASIRMIACGRFGLAGTHTMADIVAAAYAAGVLAIGWRHTADGSVVLNADAGATVTLAAADELVVVG